MAVKILLRFRKAFLIDCLNDSVSGFASQRPLTGLKNTCHPFDQSDANVKKIAPCHSRFPAQRQFACFYFEFLFNPCDTFFALIGRFYYFAFVFKIFNLNLR